MILKEVDEKKKVYVVSILLSFLILWLMTVLFTNVQSSNRFFSSHIGFYLLLAGILGSESSNEKMGKIWFGVKVLLTTYIVFYFWMGTILFTVGFPWT